MRPKAIVILGVHPASTERGGIYSVIDVYKQSGLFDRWPVVYIGTYTSGTYWNKILVAVVALWQYMGLLITGRVALVHAHSASRASFWRKSIFILLAFAARRPVLLHLHGAEFDKFYNNECGQVRKWFVRFVFSHVDRVVTLSSRWKDFVLQIAEAAVAVRIFNPVRVSVESYNPAVRQDNNLLFLGRLGQRKGIFDLLEALALIRLRVPAIKLQCGGDGDVMSVKARAQELGVGECVEFLGWVSGAAKERVLSEATVYVLPSYAEGLPMGILEAMAAGAPIVASSVGGIPDAIEDGVDGFLIEPGDVDALVDRITRLLLDREKRSAFSHAAREKALSTFSPESILPQVEELYANLGAVPRKYVGE